jgi:hypothetical protein
VANSSAASATKIGGINANVSREITGGRKRHPMLRSFTLTHNKRTGDWDLNNEAGETLKSFSTRAQAIVTGMLERTVKPGTVRICNEDGTQQELTFR